MSAFNVLTADSSCPNCGRTATFEVQFKYGDTWQHRYTLGQQVRWGGNDIGIPGQKYVHVEAIGGPCPYCGIDDLEFDINLVDDYITELVPIGMTRS